MSHSEKVVFGSMISSRGLKGSVNLDQVIREEIDGKVRYVSRAFNRDSTEDMNN
jgi:hypothetical protein